MQKAALRRTVLLALLMQVSTVALWVGRKRSLAAHVYCTLLALADVATIASLSALGVMVLHSARTTRDRVPAFVLMATLVGSDPDGTAR